MKRVWLAECECYGVGTVRGTLIQVESADKDYAVSALQTLMDATGKRMGENCFAPTIREHISLTAETEND